MLVVMWVAGLLAGAIHVLIFGMESLWWTTPKVQLRFRQTPEQSQTTRLFAFNQGFYNLFLALGVFAGLALFLAGRPAVGHALATFSCLSMLGAALVLVASAPQMKRGAVIQGAAPLIFLVLAAARLNAPTPPTDHVVVTPDQLKWTPYYAGGEQTVLFGDPSRPGPYVLRVRFPAGLHIAPHYHLDNRIVQVLSGTMHFALGESGDTTRMRAIPPGSMWTEPAHMTHYAWTGDNEVVLQVVGTGPTGTVPMRPAKP
ncbi:MAG TPA: DUF1304 family protein [Gemmatimonadales bacterium]|nr:DUF1304 family protein [Gemmatimonadales bacterium]